MAQITRVKMNWKGVRALLVEPGVQDDLERRARLVAAAADGKAGRGARHRVEVEAGSTGTRRGAGGRFVSSTRRARAAVITDNFEARRAEWKKHSLIRAFGAGRG